MPEIESITAQLKQIKLRRKGEQYILLGMILTRKDLYGLSQHIKKLLKRRGQ